MSRRATATASGPVTAAATTVASPVASPVARPVGRLVGRLAGIVAVTVLATVAGLVVAVVPLAGPGLAAPVDGSPGPDGRARLGTRAGPAPAPRAVVPGVARGDDVSVRRVRVRWEGGGGKRQYQKSAAVPGIGNLTLVCRPDATLIRLYAFDRSAETQLWMAKYETKNGRSVVATKNARIYTYDHADDDGRGGTGRFAHEGLNQQSPIENWASGYLDGIISQRPGRHRSGAAGTRPPVTSVRINWWWNGFHHPLEWRSCSIDAVLTTRYSPRIGVDWHGEADAPGHQTQVATLEGIGDLEVRCEAEAGGTVDGDQWVSLAPTSPDASVWAEWVSGEGPVEDHVVSTTLDHDPVTGRVGPLLLPRNGMMRLFYDVGGVTRRLIVSSYYVTNNRRGPHRNLCEVAVGDY